MTSITVCTPWWNSHELIPAYVRAVKPEDAARVLILDQASDPPVEIPEFEVVRGKRNVGFSRACNWMLQQADTDAVLWLNNDIEVIQHGWLEKIRAQLRPGRLVGAELRADAHTTVDGRTHAYLDGWCLAGMRSDLLALGGWDEDYEEPSYFGDNDLSLRAQRAGMELKGVPVGLRHLVSYTSKRLDVVDVTSRNYQRFSERVRAA